jgi:hypothetical protein
LAFIIARATAGALVVAGSWFLYAATASASTTDGTATLGPASGGSTTQFTVNLPANAACDGDTANDGYHVYSYLVPTDTTISSLTFPGEEPSTGYGLFDDAGDYYGPANTAVTTGQIVSIPSNFEWAPLVTDAGLTVSQLAGSWETGLVCVNTAGTVTDWWVAQVTFAASGSDPNGFTWTTTSTTPTTTTPTTTTPTTTTPTTTTPTTTTPTTTTSTVTTTTSAAAATTSTAAGGGSSSSGGSAGPFAGSGASSSPGVGATVTAAAVAGSEGSDASAIPSGEVTAGASSGSNSSSIPSRTAGSAASGRQPTTSATVVPTPLSGTGLGVWREIALGVLCLGLGLIIFGWTVKMRLEGTAMAGGARP